MNILLQNKPKILSPKSAPLFHLLRTQFYRNLNSKAPNFSYTNQEDNEEDDRSLYLQKSKGQHLLTNQRILDTIVTKSAINSTDTVLEIGPGTGNLTLKLLQVAKKVISVELDKRMVQILEKRVSQRGFEDKLDIIYKDALKVKFPEFDIVVANIPYGISSSLVSKLVYGGNKYRSLTLLLQKEFARRLLANAGDSEYNRLAANVKLVADVEFVMDVSKRDFVPCPKVDSSVVIIRPKDDVPNVNFDEWKAFTKTCFSKKNKTLGAIFKQKKKVFELLSLFKRNGCNNKGNVNDDDYVNNDNEYDDKEQSEAGPLCSCSEMELSDYKERIVGVLRAAGFESKRSSKLSNEELLRLLCSLNEAGIYFHGQTRASEVNPILTVGENSLGTKEHLSICRVE